LLEKTEEDRLESFKKEAEDTKEKVDRPTIKQTQVISEKTEEPQVPFQSQSDDNSLLSNYMEALKDFR